MIGLTIKSVEMMKIHEMHMNEIVSTWLKSAERSDQRAVTIQNAAIHKDLVAKVPTMRWIEAMTGRMEKTIKVQYPSDPRFSVSS